jgi:hypothetical protein
MDFEPLALAALVDVPAQAIGLSFEHGYRPRLNTLCVEQPALAIRALSKRESNCQSFKSIPDATVSIPRLRAVIASMPLVCIQGS